MAETRVDWQRLLDEALTAPGNLSGVYDRFHNYSITNMVLFMMQGVHEPVASASRWKQLGREVTNWGERKEVIVPQFAKEPPPAPAENESLEEKRERVAHLIGFKVVRAVFPLSATDGPELAPQPTPGWDLQKALGKLGISEVPFSSLDGNIQGYSRGLEYAVNPVAADPRKTTFHEVGHIVGGHTLPGHHAEYLEHRGLMEGEAEGSALLVMNELGVLDDETVSHMRGYVQHWMQGETFTEKAARHIFSIADAILRAGRVETSEPTP
jgi:hypothetical protein